MRVLVLGGAGAVCNETTRDLAHHSDFDEIVVADYNLDTTAFEMMHEILLQLTETKETPLCAYGLVVDVFGMKDGKEVKITHWNQHPPKEEWSGKAAYYKNIAIPLSI